MSQFAFLRREWTPVFEAASKAEATVRTDPRTACFYARRTLELAVIWAYKHDAALRLPYQDNLSALIHEPSFKQAAGEAVFSKTRVINTLGNRAVHSHRAVPEADALAALRELFHVAYWFARTYARAGRPAPRLAFDPKALPRPAATGQQTTEQLRTLELGLRERDEKLATLLTDKGALDEELKHLRAEVSKAKKAAAAQPDTHDYSEAETRDYFIDLLLKEAGWPLDQDRDREFEVTGMPNSQGEGFVDYVLWGDDGKPLGVVEAKRTRRDARVGQQQAKLYADCLERQLKQRPIIFYSNGYEHWIWDDTRYPPRRAQGFYKKAELEQLIQRRETQRRLAEAPIVSEIVERHYQTRAIRRIAEAFERDHDRKALLVMATGAGKTRTVIALSDLLMRCNWAKRVLFLADRVALVNQAVNAFKRHLPDASPVNLVTEKNAEGRVYVSTHPTMMGLIDEARDGQRRFGVGHFDLIIIDEAHRSVFQKYSAIFDYFDSLLVGLTATPKDEVGPQHLPPVRTGGRRADRRLLPGGGRARRFPRTAQGRLGAAQVPAGRHQVQRSVGGGQGPVGTRWNGTTTAAVPDRVEAEAVNKWLFNKDTVDKVLAHLMTRGVTVAGGDRLGKTILFAKNQAHAEFIAERFNANYPHYKGEFARVITFKTEYAQSLIDSFSGKEKNPHVALSVDMLDTGIDVPEVVNLVFFKLVRSKTKFWQMVGRGTRLCPDLLGPGQDKKLFYLFDYCQNLEYFSQDIPGTEGSVADSLGKRLFNTRLELIATLDHQGGEAESDKVKEPASTYGDPATDDAVRRSLADLLQREVAAMNLDNFVVRPQRRLVEKYAKPESWVSLPAEALAELSHEVAGLPSELDAENEEAKRFDLLALSLQISLLRHDPGFARLRDRVKQIADLLEEKAAIPMVRDQMALIQDVQTDEWWQDVTVPMLEVMRRRLRRLVQLIDKRQRKPVYTEFEDLLGGEIDVEPARLRPRHGLRGVPGQGTCVSSRTHGPRRHRETEN